MQLSANEHLVEIKQDLPGFNTFFSSWVWFGDILFVVDVGPANTAGRLIKELSELGMVKLDYVLLTHIHIDHCGALGDLLNYYPMAKVICHEKAIKTLVEPSKLWSASRDILGDIAEAFGEPKPIERKRIIAHPQSQVKGLKVIETPGHAPHHLSFTFKGRLYAGEAGGNFRDIDGNHYLRPATPPKFFMETFLDSIDSLLALEDQPIRYAHFGGADSSRQLLNSFRQQMLRWHKIISQQLRKGEENLVERCVNLLLEQDPNLAPYKKMVSDIQSREKFYLTNSVKGFIGFLKDKKI